MSHTSLYSSKPDATRNSNVVRASPAILNNKIAALRVLANSIISEITSLEQSRNPAASDVIDLNEEVHRFEANLVRSALVRTGGRQRAAARLLNIKPTTLHEKIKRYGIIPRDRLLDLEAYPLDEDDDEGELH
jgi:DNA-binding NtrC family response regulator